MHVSVSFAAFGACQHKHGVGGCKTVMIFIDTRIEKFPREQYIQNVFRDYAQRDVTRGILLDASHTRA